MANVTVLGAGAWGTAFGQVLADAGNNVTMWAIEPEIVEGIRDHHHNGVRLPSVETLPQQHDRHRRPRRSRGQRRHRHRGHRRAVRTRGTDRIQGAHPRDRARGLPDEGHRTHHRQAHGRSRHGNARPSGGTFRRHFRTEPEQADRRPRAGRDRGRMRGHRQRAQNRHRLHHRLLPCVRDARRDRLGNVRIAEECGGARRGHGPWRRLRREHRGHD